MNAAQQRAAKINGPAKFALSPPNPALVKAPALIPTQEQIAALLRIDRTNPFHYEAEREGFFRGFNLAAKATGAA